MATLVEKMAQGKSSFSFYEDKITFVELPSHDFKCPICLGVLKEPFLTSCCGNHFCKPCIVSVKKDSSKCPLCKATPLNGIINKHFKRSLDQLKVYCIYKEMGCEWIGEYGKVEKHLDFDNEKGECQFVAVKCPLSKQCEFTILRKFLLAHCRKACKYRPYSCKYCGFQSTYVDITTQHNDVCANYPLLCPNHCSRMTYPRSQLKDHIAECPNEKIACTFYEMGCKELVKRRLLSKHLECNAVYHQTIMCQTFAKELKSLVKDNQSLVNDKKILEKKIEVSNITIKNLQEKVNHLSREINMLKVELKSLSNESPSESSVKILRDTAAKLRLTNWPLHLSKMVEISAIQPILPVVFKIPFTIIKEHRASWLRYDDSSDKRRHYTSAIYYSSPFYSQSKGHKLQLSAKIICHCAGCSNDHSSKHSDKDKLSLSIDVHAVEGEYDFELKWPLKQKITVTLLNEVANKNHHSCNEECYWEDHDKLHAAVPQGEAPQQTYPIEPSFMQWGAKLSQAQRQENVYEHCDFMTFPLEIKGNFLLREKFKGIYQGNYIGEHQTYVYVQVRL